jgi:pyrroline-5-carboxylate reductase
MKNIVLIGSGNVATHLGIALKNEGYNILQVWSMQVENAKALANKLDCKFTSSLYDLEKADLYITSVKDDKIAEVISNFQNINIAHTSGSIGLEILLIAGCFILYRPLIKK